MATKGSGVKIGYADQPGSGVASGGFAYFGKVTELGGISLEADSSETSNMDSPVDENGLPWKEFTATWADGGDVEVTIQYAAAQAATAFGLFAQDKSFEILFKDGSHLRFNGFISKFGIETERTGIISQGITMKVSGIPEFAAA